MDDARFDWVVVRHQCASNQATLQRSISRCSAFTSDSGTHTRVIVVHWRVGTFVLENVPKRVLKIITSAPTTGEVYVCGGRCGRLSSASLLSGMSPLSSQPRA